MDVLDAAYRVAHDFTPHGAVGLAKKMGVPAGTFLNELNPEAETHKLGLGRAVAMSVAASDARIVHAFADTCGLIAFPKPDLSNVSDAALLDLWLAHAEADGRFAEEVRAALADGEISERELESVRTMAYGCAAAVLEIVMRLEGLRDG